MTQIATHMRGYLSVVATELPDAPPHVLLALSGGIDSVVLLHVLCQLADSLPLRVSAMHVHHGLSQHADDWLVFCANLCEQLGVPFYSQRVQVDTHAGTGIEAAARAARYAALASQCQQIAAQAIVTAHHQQDQSETLMLQLVRGAGVKGLSGMAAWDPQRQLLRPMLTVSKQEIQQYATRQQLAWVEDDSNTDTRYERNFMRLHVLPVLRDRYPHVDEAMVRSASHLADAQVLLDVLASQDLQHCGLQSEWMGASIALPDFYDLGEVRAKNLLRGWFQQQQLLMPNSVQLHEYWQQLVSVKPHGYLHLPLSDVSRQHAAFLHHYQGRLYCVRKPPALPAQPLVWQGATTQVWGDWLLEFRLVKGKGIALARLGISPADITLHLRYGKPLQMATGKQLLIHARRGGELLQPHANRPRRELKMVFQMLGIPPWQRALYPLVSVQHDDAQTLLGLLPSTINANWSPGRNAYGLVISFIPLAL